MKLFSKILLISLISLIALPTFANLDSTEELKIYKIDKRLYGKGKVLKRGTDLELVLLNDISSSHGNVFNKVGFYLPIGNMQALKVSGSVSDINHGARFSMNGSIGFSTNSLRLDDGLEVPFSARSLKYKAYHPPHVKNNQLQLARRVATLAAGSSPLTLGIGLGASFVINGLLSAHANGPGDFFWGGFSGIGLSVPEQLLRRQPDVNIASGTSVPFKLTNDLKIDKGIRKEKLEKLDISDEEARAKIDQLLEWGDLSGALELSVKTGQKDYYNELLEKISS